MNRSWWQEQHRHFFGKKRCACPSNPCRGGVYRRLKFLISFVPKLRLQTPTLRSSASRLGAWGVMDFNPARVPRREAELGNQVSSDAPPADGQLDAQRTRRGNSNIGLFPATSQPNQSGRFGF